MHCSVLCRETTQLETTAVGGHGTGDVNFWYSVNTQGIGTSKYAEKPFMHYNYHANTALGCIFKRSFETYTTGMHLCPICNRHTTNVWYDKSDFSGIMYTTVSLFVCVYLPPVLTSIHEINYNELRRCAAVLSLQGTAVCNRNTRRHCHSKHYLHRTDWRRWSWVQSSVKLAFLAGSWHHSREPDTSDH